MAHRRDAERIVKNLDGEKMAGEKVDIQHAKGKRLCAKNPAAWWRQTTAR